MDLSSNIALGTVLVQKSGSRGRFLVTHVVVTSTNPRIYVRGEGNRGNEVWDISCVMLEDVGRLFTVEEEIEGLDI